MTIADITVAVSLTMPTILEVTYTKYEKLNGKILIQLTLGYAY